MVRDLIVGEERVVDSRHPTKHVGNEHEETGFLHHRRRAGANKGVLEMPRDARLLVSTHLMPGLVTLAHNVSEKERERAGKGIGVAVIGDIAPRDIALAITDRAVGAEAIWGVAAKHVPSAGSIRCEQTIYGRELTIKLARRLHLAGDHQLPCSFVIPAECRNSGVISEED